MVTITNDRNDYIILSRSNTGSQTNIYIRSNIITYDSNNDTNTFFKSEYGNDNYKDRIILSQKLSNDGADNLITSNSCLITQNNIKNNTSLLFISNPLLKCALIVWPWKGTTRKTFKSFLGTATCATTRIPCRV